MTRKWIIVNDQSNSSYDVGNDIIYSTEFLKSNRCDYNDAYIRHQVTQVAFRNCAPFTKCIKK